MRAGHLRRSDHPRGRGLVVSFGAKGKQVDFDIPEELQLIARTVRDFVETRLQPLEKQVEETDKIPDGVLKEMAELGFFGLPFPEEYGGAGAGGLGSRLALRRVRRHA